MHIEDMRARVETLRTGLDAALADLDRQRHEAARSRRPLLAVAAALTVVGGSALAVAASSPGTTVSAPFTVVGSNNAPLVRIGGDGEANALAVFGGKRNMLLKIQASEADSFFAATDGTASALLGVEGKTPYLKLKHARVERVLLDAVDGHPRVELKGADGHGVVQLSQNASGGGALLVAKPGGAVMVEASVSAGGVGRVETRPIDPKNPRGSPIGSFIVGATR